MDHSDEKKGKDTVEKGEKDVESNEKNENLVVCAASAPNFFVEGQTVHYIITVFPHNFYESFILRTSDSNEFNLH